MCELLEVQANLANDPRINQVDKAVELGNVDEVLGGENAFFRVLPANQGFDAGHLVGCQINDRLVKQEKFGLGNRLLQVLLDFQFVM